jgi:DNA-binding beta-propeller fold protein YncE
MIRPGESQMQIVRHSLRFVLSCVVLVTSANVAAAQTPSSARLLVLLRNASALAIVDPATGKVLGRVPVGRDPHEVAVTPDGATAFVASPGVGISMIDVRAMKEIRRIDTGTASAPHDVLYAGGKLYFTAEGYKSIGRYDPAANKVDWMLGIGQDGTHLLVLAKDQQTMWVPNRGSNSVSVIDAVAGGPPRYKVTAIPLPGLTPEGLDLSPDGRELWTATRGDGAVSIIDTSTRRVKESFGLRLTDANRLKFTPDGSKVIILDGGTGTLIVLDAKTRKEIKRLKVADRDTGDGGVFVMPDGSRAYLGLRDDHSVVEVNLTTLEMANRFPMGPDSGPGCINWAALR